MKAKNAFEKLLKDRNYVLDERGRQIWILDGSGTYFYANSQHLDFMGCDVIGLKVSDVMSESCVTEITNRIGQINEEDVLKFCIHFPNGQGEVCRLSVTLSAYNDKKNIPYYVFSAVNVTDDQVQFQLEFADLFYSLSRDFLKVQLEDFDLWFNNSLKAIYDFFSPEYLCYYKFNKSKKNMRLFSSFGVEETDKRRKLIPFKNVIWFVNEMKEGNLVHIDFSQNNLGKKEKNTCEFLNLDKGGSYLFIPIQGINFPLGFLLLRSDTWSQLEINLLQKFTEFLSGAFQTYHDHKRVRALTFHDALTGLYNRLYLQEEMDRLDTERQLPITMIMADLNGLKVINDTYGHRAGDKLLKKVAEILTSSFRQEDIVTRWGGDEFIIFLPKTPIEEAEKICERIGKNCDSSYVEDIPVSIALGMAEKKEQGKSLRKVLEEADYNMYQNKLARRKRERKRLLDTILTNLSKKSYETREHIKEMEDLALKLGEKLNLPKTELDRLRLVINLHDIGKITLPREILMKEGGYTSEEWERVKQHPEIGYRIIKATEEYVNIAKDVLCHHENWDGSGYPNGLRGDEIPLLSQITSIVDAYEVMKNGRPYRPAMSNAEIVAELKKSADKQFDSELVHIFLDIIAAYETKTG